MPDPAPTGRFRDASAGAVVIGALSLLVLWLVADAGPHRPEPAAHPIVFLITLAVGLLIPVVYATGWRAAGFLTFGVGLAGGALVYHLFDGPSTAITVGLFGAGGGLAVGAVGRYFTRGGRPLQRLFKPWILIDILALGVLGLIAVGLLAWRDPDATPWAGLGLWLVLTGFVGVRLFRAVWELGSEVILWVFCDIRFAGPGLTRVPYDGPVLVMANHVCFWDPLFLAKALSRPITPMMTAKFFDKWFLRPLMVHTFRVIRVPEMPVRRETPEVAEAIAALDRGECVVIFPEGYLRRKEDVELRRFGRGIWEILRARPDTPVIASWIEGAWGSWVSFRYGPPTTNKPLDIRRPIGVGLSVPITIKPDVLADMMRTRIHLMNEVNAARDHLGLPRLPTFELPAKGEEESPA